MTRSAVEVFFTPRDIRPADVALVVDGSNPLNRLAARGLIEVGLNRGVATRPAASPAS